MSFVWALFIGLIVGAVAKFIMPGKDPDGIIITILLGIAGAEVGTFIGRTIGWYGPNQGARFIGSVVGAVIILGIYRWYVGRRANTGGPAGPRY